MRYPRVIKIDKPKKVFVQGKTDLDFLFSGVVMAEARKQSVALISNDIGILHARNILLRKECLSPRNLAFFTRVYSNNFKIMRPFKR
tara:strand:- start:230 stop:490 length:261 start_codon:yes stop_codon:yes gene_type:complete